VKTIFVSIIKVSYSSVPSDDCISYVFTFNSNLEKGDKIKEDERSETSGTHGTDDKCIQKKKL
jgi:hypothetical protein